MQDSRLGEKRHHKCVQRILLLLLVGFACVATRAWAAHEVFDARGFAPNRDFFTQLPYEHIDPLTGNLLLTFTAARYRTFAGKQAISPAALSFHELAEAFGRVDRGLEYQPAHDQAAARERTLVQQRPGFTQGLAGVKVERVP